MKPRFKNSNSFLKGAGLSALLVVSLLGALYMMLSRVGETSSIEEITTLQAQKHGCLFGTATYEDTYHYKLALFQKIKPGVVALGSSRVMQFKSSMFAPETRFLNMGGAFNTVGQGIALTDEIVKSPPRLVLLGLDPWWFNPDYSGSAATRAVMPEDHGDWSHPSPTHLYRAVQSVQSGALWRAYRRSGHACRFGIPAQIGEGFYDDGFRVYGMYLAGEESNPDAGFKETLGRIAAGNLRFEHGKTVRGDTVAALSDLVRRLEKAGSKVIIFFPPFPPQVEKELQSDDYAYIEDLKSELADYDLKIYDYSNPQVIGSDQCEFLDGLHGGDVTFARIVEILGRSETIVRDMKSPHLSAFIRRNAGKSYSNEEKILPHVIKDPLKLGCR